MSADRRPATRRRLARGVVVTLALAVTLALTPTGALVGSRASAAPASPAPASAAPASAAPASPATGFDHLSHRTRVEVSGQAVPPCGACHALTATGALAGRPGHAACFPCHGPSPRVGGKAVASPVCVACHPPAGLGARRPPVATVAYGPDVEHGVQLDHARHDAPCEQCHPRTARPGLIRPHTRCASCHLTQAPTMTACEACHPSEFGANTRPRLQPGPFAVGDAYSHDQHAARAGAHPAAACASCHQTLAGTHARELPTPAVTSCSPTGCHDGRAGFAITVACTRCHTRAAEVAMPALPERRFRHRDHAALTTIEACDGCHRLDRRGEPTAPAHAACSDGACHASDYGSPTPTTCGSCHLSAEPWRRLQPDQRPPADTEFAVALPHARHPASCTSCHQRTTPGRPLRPPRGHAACAASGCHAVDGGPAPRLAACAGCHRPGFTDPRRRRDDLALWSVRAAFDHDRHRVDPRDGTSLPCTGCHLPAATAASSDQLPPPGKPSCAPCHDGAVAFKMTGHGCARCHRGSAPAPEPPP